jgi:predicted secreted protein
MNSMQPSVVRAAMARLAASAATLLALALPATAGDRALIDYVGFSKDFRYFAFEEFGIQDGSGFAYSNIFVVDLDTDSWVIGTPVRVQAESEETSLVKVRSQAAQQAADHVDEFDLTVPVEVAAMIGDGVPDTDAATLTFGAPGYMPGAVSGNYRLELTTYDTTAVSPCGDWFGVNPKGYALTITDQGSERLIHRDAGLPRSRGCPLDYRLHSVVMPFEGATLSNAVAIISVYPGGFEGPDRRFLAVPLGL